MTIKQRVLRLFVSYILAAFFLSFFVFLLFQTPFFGHTILFYRGIIIIVTATLLTLLSFFATTQLLRKRGIQTPQIPSAETYFSSVVAIASLHLCFFILVPVTLDRSVSTFLLSRMNSPENSQGITKEQMQTIFVQEYVNEFDAVGRRINEQLASNNIKQQNEKFVLTPQGQNFLSISSYIAKLYNIDSRYLESGQD